MNTKVAIHKYRLNKWTEIIYECRSSSQTVSAWCTEYNINQIATAIGYKSQVQICV